MKRKQTPYERALSNALSYVQTNHAAIKRAIREAVKDKSDQVERASDILRNVLTCSNNGHDRGVCPQCRESIENFIKENTAGGRL